MAAAAEGSSNPYWDLPANESKNIEAVRSKVEAAGGEAMIFWLAKSHNRNCLIFVWDGEKVVPRWLVNEEAHRRKHLSPEQLARGDPCMRPLTENEVPFMGCETNIGADGSITVVFNALEDTSDAERMRCNLVADADGNLGLLTKTKDGKDCRLDFGYIQCKRGLLMDVDYINIYARTFDGETVVEAISAA